MTDITNKMFEELELLDQKLRTALENLQRQAEQGNLVDWNRILQDFLEDFTKNPNP